jgi:hypothetical protein
MSTSKPRKALTIKEKKIVLDLITSEGSYRKAQNSLKEIHNHAISVGAIANIEKNRHNIFNHLAENGNREMKRVRLSEEGTLDDDAVKEWFDGARARNLPVTGALLQQKAHLMDLESDEELQPLHFTLLN